MNNKNAAEEIELRILNEFATEPGITQRVLADRLGIALGLVNAYIKRLYKKGSIKITNIPSNRLKYMITTKGFAEKAKLTYSYMQISLDYFKDLRSKIEHTYSLMTASGIENILLWGDGEIAEICYISARGLPLNILGVVSENGIENGFFGKHIYSAEAVKNLPYDAILVACLGNEMTEDLYQFGVSPNKVYYL